MDIFSTQINTPKKELYKNNPVQKRRYSAMSDSVHLSNSPIKKSKSVSFSGLKSIKGYLGSLLNSKTPLLQSEKEILAKKNKALASRSKSSSEEELKILQSLYDSNPDKTTILTSLIEFQDDNKKPRLSIDEIKCLSDNAGIELPESKLLFDAIDPSSKKLRFNYGEIIDILKGLNYVNADSLEIILKEQGDYKDSCRFKASDISKIMSQITPENKQALKSILDCKNKYGHNRFSGDDVAQLIKTVNPENESYLKTLLNAKDDYNRSRFDSNQIELILKSVNSTNRDRLDILLRAKNNSGNFLFDFASSIAETLEKSANVQLTTMQKSLKAENNGFPRIISYLGDIFGKTNAENEEALLKILDDKSSYRINPYHIPEILSVVNKDNLAAFTELFDAKRGLTDSYRFSSSDIIGILKDVNAENAPSLKKILDVKAANGMSEYSYLDIVLILESVNSRNRDHLDILLKAKDNDGYPMFRNISSIFRILEKSAHVKPDILEKLVQAENNGFSGIKDNIPAILGKITPKNDKVLDYLLALKNAQGQGLIYYQAFVPWLDDLNNENADCLETILNSKTFKKQLLFRFQLPELFKKINNDNKSCINTLLNSDRFNDPFEIETILPNINKVNAKYVDVIVNSVDEKGKYKFENHVISALLNMINEVTLNFFDKVLSTISSQGSCRFSMQDIFNMARFIDSPEYQDRVGILLEDKRINFEILEKVLLSTKDKDEVKRLLNKKDENGNLLRSLQLWTACTMGEYGIPPEKILDAKSIYDLSKDERKALLYYYCNIHGNYNYRGCLGDGADENRVSEFFNIPLLKFDDDSISALCDKLANSLKDSRRVKPLSIQERVDFYRSLESLEKSLKKTDILDLASDSNGLPLKYPREKLNSDFVNYVSKLPRKIVNQLIDYNYVSISEGHHTFHIYKGMPVPDNLPPKIREVVERVKGQFDRFHNDNCIVLPDKYKNSPEHKELVDSLNCFIKTFPEFLEIISRKQHNTHKYTLDVHILKALQELLRDQDFDKLPKIDKKIAKLALLFHDISKQEGVVDPEHEYRSALSAYSSLEKLSLTDRERERVYSLIDSHNWLKDIADTEQEDLDEKAKEYAYAFRKPGDFKIAKMFARSDMKAVSTEFYEAHKSMLDSDRIKLIESYLDKIHNTGIWLPQTRIPKASQLKMEPVKLGSGCYETVNKVVKLTDHQDLEALGFNRGTNPDEFYSIIHCIDENNPASVSSLDYACKEGCNGVLSASFVDGHNFKTYYRRKFGLIFDVDPANIAAAYPANMGSGYLKDDNLFKDVIFSNCDGRTHFSNAVKLTGKYSDSEYAELFRKLELRRSLSDIEDLNDRRNIRDVADSLNNPKAHNELVVYAPKPIGIFAKKCKPEDVPYQLRKYAQENDLPIIIFGRNK